MYPKILPLVKPPVQTLIIFLRCMRSINKGEKKMVANYKNIDGERYGFGASHFTKAEAKQYASNRRKWSGYKARVIKREWGSKKTGGKVTDYIVWLKK
jgi:hypothetical protein